MTTIWSDFPEGGWEATVQESRLEQRNRSSRYCWWSSRPVMWVGKSTIWVGSGVIANSWQNRPASSVVWEWQNHSVIGIAVKRKHIRLVFNLKNSLSSNQKIALAINTKAVYMPSILAMDWQVARQLEIRVLDVFMQVGFTESKDVRVVLEHKCFKIC